MPALDRPLVISVVLTWNNFEDTDECLESVVLQRYAPHKVVLVDNGSRDGSLEKLRDKWSGQLELVENPSNLGVAAGYNAGIRAALALGAGYVALLNNDVVLDPCLIDALAGPFEDRPKTAICSPVIVYLDRPKSVWFARGVYNRFLGYSRHAFLSQPLASLSNLLGRTFESDYIPLCSALISRPAFEAVGLLDDRFFAGHEDVDWCLRAQAAGYRCVVLGKALVRHKVSVTGGVRGSNVLSAGRAYHFARGGMLVCAKHARGLRLVTSVAGQVLLRFPFYAAGMLLHGRPGGALLYAGGVIDGLWRYVIRGAGSGPDPAPRS